MTVTVTSAQALNTMTSSLPPPPPPPPPPPTTTIATQKAVGTEAAKTSGASNTRAAASTARQRHIDKVSKLPLPGRVAVRPFLVLAKDSLVVGQEFSLTCYLLAWHRVSIEGESTGKTRHGGATSPTSLLLSTTSLLLAFIYVATSIAATESISAKRNKAKQRLSDIILVGLLLRIFASLLRTLTASYSSDTVLALSISSLVLHMLTFDRAFGIGRDRIEEVSVDSSNAILETRAFSLNAVFLSSTLLASRMQRTSSAFTFIYLTIILFAYYPEARFHFAQQTSKSQPYAPAIVTLLIVIATCALLSGKESVAFLSITVTICAVVPAWKFVLQRYKRPVKGPWDPFRL